MKITEYKTEIITVIFTALLTFSIVRLTLEAAGIVAASKVPSSEQYSSSYTVKEYDGKIAIFRSGEESPERVLSSPYVRNLPEADRERLKNGITVETNAELNALLEDYES